MIDMNMIKPGKKQLSKKKESVHDSDMDIETLIICSYNSQHLYRVRKKSLRKKLHSQLSSGF